MPGAKSFDYWFTTSETGTDRRTGAYARLIERRWHDGDRAGKNLTVWDWAVLHDHALIARGVSQTQGRARRKCRDAVEKLPSAEKRLR